MRKLDDEEISILLGQADEGYPFGVSGALFTALDVDDDEVDLRIDFVFETLAAMWEGPDPEVLARNLAARGLT